MGTKNFCRGEEIKNNTQKILGSEKFVKSKGNFCKILKEYLVFKDKEKYPKFYLKSKKIN